MDIPVKVIAPLVSVGLVTWNSAACLPACLEALTGQDYPNLELIVVDNASTDLSLAVVSEYVPGARVICNPGNTGFCHAHNQAIRASSGAYYLALNPDVTLQPGYLATLVSSLEVRPDFGSSGGKLLLPPEGGGRACIDSTGLFMDRRRRQFIRGHGEIDLGQYDQDGEVFGLDGAAPLYRKAMLDDIQIFGEFFDESFFAHKEDVDLAWRARLLGWRCWYAHEALAFHKRSFRPGIREAVSPAVRVHAVKNRYLLLLKNESKAGWRRDGLQILWYDFKIFIYLCIFERSSLSALGLVRRNWNGALAWRHEIASRSRIDPSCILSWFR
jgi:GT2 family glycosyltransferase